MIYVWWYSVSNFNFKVNDIGSRQTVALVCPSDGTSDAVSTSAFTLTTQIKNNIIYIVILPDPDPPIHLHNNCNVSFCVGQTLIAPGIPGTRSYMKECILLADE